MRPAAVLDAGTHSVKAGLAGADRPSAELPTAVGRPKHRRVLDGGRLPELATGSALAEHRGALSLSRPMARGLVEPHAWDDMERVWRAAFGEPDGIRVDPRAQPVRL